MDNAKQSAADALKTASKRAEATGDLTGNKIADKMTSTALQSNRDTASQTDEKSIEIPKERHLSTEKRIKWIIKKQ